jgi:hypothetical protein
MDMVRQSLDMTPLRSKGIQHIPSFFPEAVKQDLINRAQEIIALRDAGKLTTHDQDSQGLPYEWFGPLVHDESIVELMKDLIGPDVVGLGWRILAKDKHFHGQIHIHQDWPYNAGDTRKVSVFVPLTRVNAANGGLVFFEESHLYGPVSRGPIDPSRFARMDEFCPDIAVGDLLVCDFLTWHYSNRSENLEERIMIQLNYQTAADSSGGHLVAGSLPHNRRPLRNRFDAVSVPSVELNCTEARAYFAAGDLDHARRWSRGLLFDDPQHAGAAILLYDILLRDRDPAALEYLEMARAAVTKMQAEIALRDEQFAQQAGLGDDASAEGGDPWKKLELGWKSHLPSHEQSGGLPATLATPEAAWTYGASTDLIHTHQPATIRVRAKALKGKIGICLLSEDWGNIASEPHVITPEAGDATVMIAFAPEKSPARLLIRNHDDDGVAGEVVVNSVDIIRYD